MFMKIKTVTIFSIFFLVFLSSNLLFADNKAMVTYIEGTLDTPQYRQWNGISWSGEASVPDVGGVPYWHVLRACPVREERILGTLDSGQDINISTWTPSGGWAQEPLEVTNAAGTISKRAFDIAYEQNSGDAIIVYSVNPDGSFKTSVGGIYEKFSIITATITDGAYNFVVLGSTIIPSESELLPCAPNPFVVSRDVFAVINYKIVNAGSVKLKVYNIAGELVKMLVNSHHQPGSYYVKWFGDNGSVGDDTGQKVGSGVYIYMIVAEGFRDSGKVILIR